MPQLRPRPRSIAFAALALIASSSAAQTPSRTAPVWSVPADAYYPDPGVWQKRSASQVGLDSAKLAAAIQFAIGAESKAPRDLEIAHYQTFGREPFGNAVGPFKTRGEPSGVIIRRGYVVAEWGEPERVDMTFSVTKSFLSTVVGLAVDRGLIRSVKDTVAGYVGPILSVAEGAKGLGAESPADGRWLKPFESVQNKRITWDDMLRQTSDWEGTLWGKPDWADRPTGQPATWLQRARVTPGTVYEYNDVRVNVLALAALNVWRRPLPEVLREQIMDPIGASSTWRWYGYDNSWIVLDGRNVQAVGGGGHWGGGMFISARDMARYGLLTLRRGQWKGKRLLSEQWVSQALTPTSAELTYGYMNWFLNTDRKYAAAAPANAFIHVGNGTNIIYCDPTNDIVAVVRWIENGQVNGFIERMLAAVGR
jgi:CubicO group peptidase (beta-lactamase class C family)